MSALGLVSTLRHPELSSVLSEDIIQFEFAYERYLTQIEEVNHNRTPSNRIKPTSRKSCIAPELLSAHSFAGVEDLESLDNNHIMAWMNSRKHCSAEDLAIRVEAALNGINFKSSRTDPVGAAIMFFSKVYTELRRNGAESAITNASKPLITLLIPKLQPQVVRDTIKTEHPYWPSEKRYDLKYFQSKVCEISRESAKYLGKRGRPEDDQKTQGEKTGKRNLNNGNKKTRLITDDSSRNQHGPGRGSSRNNGGEKARTSSDKEWTTPCLNTKCDLIHPLRECKNTTDAEKDELFKKRRAGKHWKKVSALRGIKLTEGRWKATVEDKITSVALGDIGADWSAVPQRMIDDLQACGVYISTTALEKPIELEVAVKMPQNISIKAVSKARLNIKLMLPCGPLRLRRVEFLVIDHDMEEILLGRPLLKCLGFDLETHLAKIRTQFDDVDIGNLMNESLESSLGGQGKFSRFASYTGLRYATIEDDPINLPEAAGASIGTDDPAEIDSAIKEMVQQATNNGMSKNGIVVLQQTLSEYRDVFRIKLGLDPPANVPPLRIKLKPGTYPVRATQRRYAPAQRVFISNAIRKLEGVGAIYHNPHARWASPALAVAKPGPEKFRFTVDLRAPNAVTEPIASAMPNLESLFQTIRGSTVFANIDLCHAYWQIPLHTDSRECMSIQTPLGVYTPHRVLQGGTDAGNHFQACTAMVFQDLSECLLQWLDDFLLHAATEPELLERLQKFFSLCAKFGLKVHPTKSHLFMKEAHFCGRIIDGDGVRFDPRRLETLLSMSPPERGNELQQFICAANWMRSSIPAFSKQIAPLHKLMESCYAKCNKRTKRAVRSIQLSGLWGTVHDVAFRRIKDQLGQSLRLAYPRDGFIPCLFSDASEDHWSSVLTQVPKSQMDLPV